MSELYPVNVDVNQKDIEKLAQLLGKFYNRMVKEVSGATDFGVANRRAILAQIDKMIKDTGVDVQKFFDETLPKYYKEGANNGVDQLYNIGANVEVATGFNNLHRDAIVALVDETVQSSFEALTGVKRAVTRMLGKTVRDLVTEEIAYGVVGGEAIRKVRERIKGVLVEQGLPALVDRSGRQWQLGNYADMLFRTKAVEARNIGLTNRLSENGYDLVQVSSHATSCKLCAPWQGEILSLTGKTAGYTTLQTATSNGLFHPNCRHAINALIPSLAKDTRAYNPETGKYSGRGATVNDAIAKQLEKNIIQPAMDYQDQFKADVAKVASVGGWEHMVGPVKKTERSLQKVMGDYNGNLYGLKDSNRSVLFIDNPKSQAEFDKMVDATRSVFGNASVKNGLDVTSGYAKSMINVKLADGRLVELQVTTREMWQAKKVLGGDDLYDIVRVKADDWQKAEERMTKLYQDARDAINTRLAG